jgi:DNA-binding response OmpR family regulator
MASQRVLIIDDEENIRQTMQIALEAEGYVVGTAADGPEGLRRFREREGWDLVLLDQRMPGMEGLEVLRRIREIDPAACIVMVTAYGTIELAVDAMRAGATDFLRKPFTPDVLRGAVRGALATHPPEAEFRLPVPTPPLPSPGAAPRRAEEERPPLVTFRTLNGFSLWPLKLADDEATTEALRIRRIFVIRAPAGEQRRVTVDVTTSVQEMIRRETGRELPPGDDVWETICRYVLSNQLWRTAELPPDAVVVYDLSPEELGMLTQRFGAGWRR